MASSSAWYVGSSAARQSRSAGTSRKSLTGLPRTRFHASGSRNSKSARTSGLQVQRRSWDRAKRGRSFSGTPDTRRAFSRTGVNSTASVADGGATNPVGSAIAGRLGAHPARHLDRELLAERAEALDPSRARRRTPRRPRGAAPAAAGRACGSRRSAPSRSRPRTEATGPDPRSARASRGARGRPCCAAKLLEEPLHGVLHGQAQPVLVQRDADVARLLEQRGQPRGRGIRRLELAAQRVLSASSAASRKPRGCAIPWLERKRISGTCSSYSSR